MSRGGGGSEVGGYEDLKEPGVGVEKTHSGRRKSLPQMSQGKDCSQKTKPGLVGKQNR